MLACMTGFRGWIEAINLDQGAPVPLAFILQLTDELTPSDIGNSFSKFVVLNHILDGQTLHANHLVFVHYACGEFVLAVSSTVVDTSMNTGNFAAGFLPVLGTLFLFRMPTLGFRQSFLIPCVVAGIAHASPVERMTIDLRPRSNPT